MGPEASFVHENKTVGRPARVSARFAGVLAPLLEPLHLLGQVQLHTALRFQDEHFARLRLYKEIRDVVREVAVRLHVVDLEADREIVLGERGYVGRALQELRELQLEPSAHGFWDDLVEDRFLRRQVFAVSRSKGAHVTQANPVLDA